MENAYGIGVKNRYELFYDEDVDPLEILRKNEEEKEKRKVDKTNPKEKSKPVKNGKPSVTTGMPKKTKDVTITNPTKTSESTETSNKPRPRPFSDRNNSKPPRSFDESKDGEERKNFRYRDDHGPSNSENRERDGEFRRGRGGFRGRGGGGRLRGRGGYFNNFEGRPPRREFDRHSGNDKSGLRAVEKRDGAGSNNWGDMKSEYTSRRKEPDMTWMDEDNEHSGEKQNESWGEIPSENIVSSPGKDEVPVEKTDETTADSGELKENVPALDDRSSENAKEMTLDEWKREQEAKRAVPKYNLRKPGEGEDGNQWKKLYVLKKKAKADNEEDEDDEEEDDDVDDDEFARRGRQRQLVDIQINFNDSRRGRGRGRGTRGIGPRNERRPSGDKDIHREDRREPLTGLSSVGGRSYRGSMKMNKSGQQSAPRVDDWNDFPSLVTA